MIQWYSNGAIVRRGGHLWQRLEEAGCLSVGVEQRLDLVAQLEVRTAGRLQLRVPALVRAALEGLQKELVRPGVPIVNNPPLTKRFFAGCAFTLELTSPNRKREGIRALSLLLWATVTSHCLYETGRNRLVLRTSLYLSMRVARDVCTGKIRESEKIAKNLPECRRTSFATEGSKQPSSCNSPRPIGGTPADAQGTGDFLTRKSCKKTQFDQLSGLCVVPFQLSQCFVKGQ